MGHRVFDQYSLLHASIGTLFYFWSVPFLFSFIGHFLFEVIENTSWGMKIINTYFTYNGYIGWPGGKSEADSLQNIVGDNISFVVGYFLAFYLDMLGKKNNWYYL
jgi:hypothetical protein